MRARSVRFSGNVIQTGTQNIIYSILRKTCTLKQTVFFTNFLLILFITIANFDLASPILHCALCFYWENIVNLSIKTLPSRRYLQPVEVLIT